MGKNRQWCCRNKGYDGRGEMERELLGHGHGSELHGLHHHAMTHRVAVVRALSLSDLGYLYTTGVRACLHTDASAHRYNQQ